MYQDFGNGASRSQSGWKKMIETEERYWAEFKDIDYSGITDIVHVVACW